MRPFCTRSGISTASHGPSYGTYIRLRIVGFVSYYTRAYKIIIIVNTFFGGDNEIWAR